MNRDQMMGNWTEFKGKLREKYGDLTDDEVEQAKGNEEQLAGLIQQKYGKTKEEAREELDHLMK
ncbi:MAG: CsbD family protein [Paracoccaceae bacterium]